MNGNTQGTSESKLELKDIVTIETEDKKILQFECVGIVEDEDDNAYGVLYNEQEDDFVITDDMGNIIQDAALAQEILDDFLVWAEESAASPEND